MTVNRLGPRLESLPASGPTQDIPALSKFISTCEEAQVQIVLSNLERSRVPRGEPLLEGQYYMKRKLNNRWDESE